MDLTSWKEIARHIGVNVRTAQRWEVERGLPVRRLRGDRGRVVASTEELDAWLKDNQGRRGGWGSLRLWRALAVGSTAAVVLGGTGAAVAYLIGRPGPPADYRLDSRSLTITDARNRVRWRFAFPDLQEPERFSPWFADLEGDGRLETLFGYGPVDSRAVGDTLYCFSEDGRVRWRFAPQDAVQDAGSTFRPPWAIRAMQPVRAAVAVSFAHHYAYPCRVVLLDPGGRVTGEYRHPGHLNRLAALDLDGDGVEEVLAGGVDYRRKQAVLIVLDRAARERAAVWFPRTAVSRKLDYFNTVSGLVVNGGRLQVAVREQLRGGGSHVTYVLARNLEALQAEPGYGVQPVDAEQLRREVEVQRR